VGSRHLQTETQRREKGLHRLGSAGAQGPAQNLPGTLRNGGLGIGWHFESGHFATGKRLAPRAGRGGNALGVRDDNRNRLLSVMGGASRP